MEKIEEIEKMIETGEVEGRRKETLLGRGQKSLGETAERIYLGRKIGSREEVRGERIKTLRGHSSSV